MPDAALQAIYIKTAKRGPMHAADAVVAQEARGLAGNANQGGRRQVTILEQEVWDDAMQALGGALEPHARRANLLVRGVRLPHSAGRILRVGEARIRILGETKPCPRMDEALPGLKAELQPDWRGGVYGEVLAGGTLRVGDSVAWEAERD
jgi:MOSC domain-containing protein YiiM